jgi:hypothetical protein
LAIALDDVDCTCSTVGESGDLLGALVLAHCGGAKVDSLNKNDNLVRSHGKAISEDPPKNLNKIYCFE